MGRLQIMNDEAEHVEEEEEEGGVEDDCVSLRSSDLISADELRVGGTDVDADGCMELIVSNGLGGSIFAQA